MTCFFRVGWYRIQGRGPVGKVGDTHIIEENLTQNSTSIIRKLGLASTCQKVNFVRKNNTRTQNVYHPP